MSPFPKHLPRGAIVGGRYRIDEILGEGGFGVVFRATQLNLDRPVALKVLRPEGLTEEGLLRFQREALIFQRLEHPNVVRLLDFGNDGPGGSPFLVFELLHGQTLDATLRAGPLPGARAARVATQILKALMEAHTRGIVHRDVKPANVFLSDFQGEPDFVKVIDFGLAKGEGAHTLTQQGGVVGTVPYMAPEQVDGREVGFAADLFALGLTLSEMISGDAVFGGYDVPRVVHALLSESPIPHRTQALASPLWPVIRRATEKAPEQRYASAREMLSHLDALVASGAVVGAAALVQVPTESYSVPDTVRDMSYPATAPPARIPPTNISPPALGPPAPERGGRHREGRVPWVAVAVALVLVLGGAIVAVLAATGESEVSAPLERPSASSSAPASTPARPARAAPASRAASPSNSIR